MCKGTGLCGFVSLGDSWCDTTNEMGRFMLTVMSGIAELERDLIRKRCAAGIARAKAKGKRFGRPTSLDASQRKMIAERYAKGEISSRPFVPVEAVAVA